MSVVSTDVFAFWSIPAFITAAMSGVVMALVVHHVTPNTRPGLTTLLVVTLGVIWYLPAIIQRALDADAPEASELRTVGTFLLYLVGFALPMSITLHLLHRRDRE